MRRYTFVYLSYVIIAYFSVVLLYYDLRGLYPRSWTLYRVTELDIVVIIRQVSPVIPNDYEDSSLPVCTFVAEVENYSDCNYEVSVAFTFRNGTGNKRWDRESLCSAIKFHDVVEYSLLLFLVNGVTLSHSISQLPCTYGLAALSKTFCKISVCEGFDPTGSGAGIWTSLLKTGDLPAKDDEFSPGSRELAVGVCCRMKLFAGETRSAEFVLVWDMPLVTFGGSGRWYRRRYTRFFPETGAAYQLCLHSLRQRAHWEELLNLWQRPILQHPLLPEWYKSAIFNELYFMTDGGSVRFFKFILNDNVFEFSKLENWFFLVVLYNHYLSMLNSYTTSLSLQLFAFVCLNTDQISHTVEKLIRFHMEGDIARVKTMSRVPHDLGNPAEEPWLSTNAYVMHDTGKWKDLNLKYVLTSWRDYIAITEKDATFLKHTWPAVKNLMSEALIEWDQDSDGMIENFGKADQTYDAWQMGGVSAYCGSLWLASLRVAAEMARIIGDKDDEELFFTTLNRAKKVFIDRLWTGEYFRFCERSLSRESIMADQLCGVWFLQSISPHLVHDVLPMDMIHSALSKIYSMNVCGFADGQMGAVNGMRPDGKVDRAYIQADEVWTGVTYAVAAFLIQQGHLKEAFHTASGCYKACFERAGLQYQTPEALYETKFVYYSRFYRAIGYMRPLSIWSMQWALERHCALNKPGESLKQRFVSEPIRKDDSASEGYASEERDGSAHIEEEADVTSSSGMSIK
uniref:NLGase n=1 Tax=Heterorhabditis bacteriophora TaxID=37862 RepID=A0A1I7XGW2_HETBA